MKAFKYVCVVVAMVCSAMPALAMQNNLSLLKALSGKAAAQAPAAKADDVVSLQPSEVGAPQVAPGAVKPVADNNKEGSLPWWVKKPRG